MNSFYPSSVFVTSENSYKKRTGGEIVANSSHVGQTKQKTREHSAVAVKGTPFRKLYRQSGSPKRCNMPIHFSRFPIKQFDFFETQAVNQVLEGEGVGWLKVNRIRKLMEDENYRNLVVSRLNKTLEQKIGPDEHIDDVVRIEKYLKLFQMDFLT